MTGDIDSTGTVTIQFNAQGEVLLADELNGVARKYLPCCSCYDVQKVPLNVISVECDDCSRDRQDDETS